MKKCYELLKAHSHYIQSAVDSAVDWVNADYCVVRSSQRNWSPWAVLCRALVDQALVRAHQEHGLVVRLERDAPAAVLNTNMML